MQKHNRPARRSRAASQPVPGGQPCNAAAIIGDPDDGCNVDELELDLDDDDLEAVEERPSALGQMRSSR